MELFDVILRRRSIRRFGSASVSDDELSRLLEAAKMGSLGGKQAVLVLYCGKGSEDDQGCKDVRRGALWMAATHHCGML